jgi:hypothetical protein
VLVEEPGVQIASLEGRVLDNAQQQVDVVANAAQP